jgi:hypothetical protein
MLVFSILQKYYSLRDTKVSILQFIVTTKHIKVFDTVVFLKTVVLIKYFKKTLLPNAALTGSFSTVRSTHAAKAPESDHRDTLDGRCGVIFSLNSFIYFF